MVIEFWPIALIVVLLGAAGAILGLRTDLGWPDALVGSMAGALVSAAAVLFGVLLASWAEERRRSALRRDQRRKIKALVTSELVNVAIGLHGAAQLLDKAVDTSKAGGQLPQSENLAGYEPRPMPFTDGLGLEILALEEECIDALSTLRSSLATTTAAMAEVTEGRRNFGVLPATQLRNFVSHDMMVLADAFARFAPTRRLRIDNEEPELASDLLSRWAGENG